MQWYSQHWHMGMARTRDKETRRMQVSFNGVQFSIFHCFHRVEKASTIQNGYRKNGELMHKCSPECSHMGTVDWNRWRQTEKSENVKNRHKKSHGRPTVPLGSSAPLSSR